jgi:hypothetical protein
MLKKSWWCIPGKGAESYGWTPKPLVLTAALAMMLGTAPAVFAQGSNQTHQWSAKPDSAAVSPNAKGPHKVGYSANFHLMPTVTPGACPDGYANQCPSGTCVCVYLEGHGNGNRIGRAPDGNVVGEITLDVLDVPGDPDGNCYPSYGAIAVVGSKDVETLDFTGAMCEAFGSGGQLQTFNGGWEFDGVSTTTYDGVGQAHGKFLKNGRFNLSFQGHALAGIPPIL